MASSTSVLGSHCCLHERTRAQMLKAEATGPRVPAIMGKADEANHQRLEGKTAGQRKGGATRGTAFADGHGRCAHLGRR